MAIRSLKELRDTAPAEFKNLDDRELVQQYSRSTGMPYEQAASFFGIAPRGGLVEGISQLGAGFAVDLPKMIGKGLQYVGAEGLGRDIAESAEAREAAWTPDYRGRGIVSESLIKGARAIGPMAPALGAAFLPGGQVVAPTIAGGLFGTSSAQESYEKLLKQGVPEEDAAAAARRVGLVQGPLEAAATYAGVRMLSPAMAALAPRTVERVAKDLTQTAVARPFLTGLAINYPTQIGTEIAQDVGTELIERAYGARPEDIGSIAAESAKGAFGLTTLLAPLGLGAAVSRGKRGKALNDALYGENSTYESSLDALRTIERAAKLSGISSKKVTDWFYSDEVQQLLSGKPLASTGITGGEQQEAILGSEYAPSGTQELEEINLLQPGWLLGDRAPTGLQQVETTVPGTLEGYAAPPPAGRPVPDLGLTAPTYGVPGVQAAAPGVYQVNEPLQQVETRAPEPAPAPAPVAPTPAPSPRAAAPFTDAKATTDTTTATGIRTLTYAANDEAGQPVDLVIKRGKSGDIYKIQAVQKSGGGVVTREIPRTQYRAAGTDAEALNVVFGGQFSLRAPSVSSGVAAPVAPPPAKPGKPAKAAGAPSSAKSATVTETATDEQAAAEDAEIEELVKEITAEIDKTRPLPAEVTGPETVKAPGRPSFPTQVFAAIRSALLNPKGGIVVRQAGSIKPDAAATEQFKPKISAIVTAMRDVAEAYNKFLNAGGNTLREKEILKYVPDYPVRGELAQAQARATGRIGALQQRGLEVQRALAKLGEAVGGNAKDVETVVRLVKDRIEKAERSGKAPAGLAAWKKLDVRLASAWAAAKREVFRETGKVDLLDVREGQVRPGRGAKGQIVSPLQDAYEKGFAPFGKGEPQSGLLGILNYLGQAGTPFERVLVKAMRRVFENMARAKLVPTVVFVEDGKPRYDPNTNTIYMSATPSPEVAIHEALHGALQWFVYKNPNLAEVKDLVAAVKKVVGFKGPLTDNARNVQTVLKNLMAGNRELDAVLELISYGNTLRDFRKALEDMPSKGVNKSFFEAAQDVWKSILAVVSKMLGGRPSLASDVIQNTFKLLEQAATAEQVTPPVQGAALQAAVQSNAATAAAIDAKVGDMRHYAKTIAPKVLSTRFLFDAIGWGTTIAPAAQKKFADMATYIRKNMPAAERALIYINSRFSMGADASLLADNYKFDKQVGYQQMDMLASYILNRSAKEVRALFDYLDGNKKALDSLPDKEKISRLADNVQQWFNAYVAELPQVEQRFFNNRKFSQSLLYAERTEQVATGTFGLGKFSDTLGLVSKNIETLDASRPWFRTDANGDLILDDQYYAVYEANNLTNGKDPLFAGFMSAQKFAELNEKEPTGFRVDRSKRWTLAEYVQDKKYKFTTSSTARELIDENKADELANAMRNTMAALASHYATKRFADGLSQLGYEDGKASALSVAFDSLDAVEEATGQRVNPRNVLSVSEGLARSPEIRAKYRRTGAWVKLPNSDNYGSLAGKYLPGPVWTAMIDMSDRQPIIPLRAVNTTMRWFKKSKTVFSPSTHVTNVASNITLAMMHDIPVLTMAKAARVFALYEVSPDKLTAEEQELMSAFMNSGAMLGQFSSAEVKQALYDALDANMKLDGDMSLMERLKAFTSYEKSKAQKLVNIAGKVGTKIDQVASEAYAAEDNIFRLAAFMKRVGDLQAEANVTKLTPEHQRTAGDFARTAFLDYDIDSKAVRVLRQTAMPFISWSYAIMPVLGRIALTQPWKFTNILMAYYLLEAAMSGMAGDDDEETRKTMPDAVRERMFFGSFGPYTHIRLPFLGDSQNPVYYKLGDYVPFASLTKGLPANQLAGQSWMPAIVQPSGPLISAVLGFIAGIDPYTGKALFKSTDTDMEKLWTTTKFAYDIVAPPPVTSRNLQKIDDIMDEKVGRTGEPIAAAAFFTRTFGGLKLYQYNVNESLDQQDRGVKKVERDFKSEMTRLKREEYSRGYPDYEALDRALVELERRMRERAAKVRGEEIED